MCVRAYGAGPRPKQCPGPAGLTYHGLPCRSTADPLFIYPRHSLRKPARTRTPARRAYKGGGTGLPTASPAVCNGGDHGSQPDGSRRKATVAAAAATKREPRSCSLPVLHRRSPWGRLGAGPGGGGKGARRGGKRFPALFCSKTGLREDLYPQCAFGCAGPPPLAREGDTRKLNLCVRGRGKFPAAQWDRNAVRRTLWCLSSAPSRQGRSLRRLVVRGGAPALRRVQLGPERGRRRRRRKRRRRGLIGRTARPGNEKPNHM